jgi:Tol biopolymer transport system component
MRGLALLALCAAVAAVPPTADAAFPGRNGKIVFVRQTHGAGGTLDVAPAIYVVNPNYTGLRPLTDPAKGAFDTSPTWSPDGKRIAFVRLVRRVSSYADGHELYVMTAEGRKLRRLTRNSAFDDHPAWSPDGKWIAFARQGPASPDLGDVSFDIWIMHADGSAPKRLTRGRDDEVEPAWSPDGTQIAYVADNPTTPGARIVVMRSDGTRRRSIAIAPLLGMSREDAFSHQRPSWSPDGKRLAFVGAKGIITVRVDGSARFVLPAGLHPAWSPDGKSLTFIRLDDQFPIGRVYVMDATGKNVRALTSAAYPLDDQQPDWQPLAKRGKGGTLP